MFPDPEVEAAKVAEQGKVAEKASDIAKSIWLAGLGAYGVALDEAADQLDKVSDKVSKETSKFFDELVEKGKLLEDQSGSKPKKQAKPTKAAAPSIEDRIAKVRHSLGFDSHRGDQIDELEKKVDELSDKLDLILEAVGSKAPSKHSRSARPRRSKK